MNHRRVSQLVIERLGNTFQKIIWQRGQRAVHQHPVGDMHDQAREGEQDLLVLSQLPIPAVHFVQHGYQTPQLHAAQGLFKGLRFRSVTFCG